MGKITGLENISDMPPKVLLMYKAVEELITEGVDINDIRVSTITDRAGIGKGTAYDYFDTKEDILAGAIVYYLRKFVDEMNEMLSGCSSFMEQVHALIEGMENNKEKQQCIIKYIHVLTDKSGVNRLIQERFSMEEAKRHLPMGVLEDMLEKGIECGEVRDDLPIEYMVYVLFSKIISYIICFGEKSMVGLRADGIRKLIYQSILDELCQKNV